MQGKGYIWHCQIINYTTFVTTRTVQLHEIHAKFKYFIDIAWATHICSHNFQLRRNTMTRKDYWVCIWNFALRDHHIIGVSTFPLAIRYTRHIHIYAQSYIFATERPSNFARVMSSLLSFLVLFLLAILHPSPRAEVLFIGRSLWKYASVHVRNTASKWQKELESLLQIWVHLCAHTEWCLHSR